MSNRISRRSIVSGALLLPFAGLGVREAFAKQDNKKKDSGAVASPSPMASPNASPSASPMASPAAGGSTDITVIAEDIKYDQDEFKILANTDVKITLENHGMLEHDFVVDDLDLEIGPIKGGEKADETINADAGEYEFYCSIPGHKEAGMVGKLIVE